MYKSTQNPATSVRKDGNKISSFSMLYSKTKLQCQLCTWFTASILLKCQTMHNNSGLSPYKHTAHLVPGSARWLNSRQWFGWSVSAQTVNAGQLLPNNARPAADSSPLSCLTHPTCPVYHSLYVWFFCDLV